MQDGNILYDWADNNYPILDKKVEKLLPEFKEFLFNAEDKDYIKHKWVGGSKNDIRLFK